MTEIKNFVLGALRLVILVWLINRNSAEVFRQFVQALVVVVPFGGSFVDQHHTLMGESELHEARLANLGA